MALLLRALTLLAASHLLVGAPAASECRSCEFSREIPPAIWQEFAESLAAVERFDLADQALAQHLMTNAGMRPRAAEPVIADATLRRFIYPWKLDLSKDRFAQGEPVAPSEKTARAVDLPHEPTRLHIPDPLDDLDERLVVSAAEVDFEPAQATQSRSSGKWYWEVRFLPGSANLPHAALLGVIDTAGARQNRDPAMTMTALPIASFAGLLGGEYLQFALDLDAGALHYGIDGSWNSDPANAAAGAPVRRGTSIAPAVVPLPPDLYPYLPDKFEFNFGGTSFRYSMPAAYRPYDVVAAEPPPIPPKPPDQSMAHRTHERAFFAEVRKFEQPFDPITAAKLREAVEAWRAYRDAACLLTARFKHGKGAAAEENCIRTFGGALLAALPTLQHWNRLSFDPPFDELPPIDLEQQPKLHYIELDGNDMPEDAERARNGLPTSTVHVTDTSAPLILFLRAHEATHWHIIVGPGVSVQHVFLFGQLKQTAAVSGTAAAIRSYSNEQDNSGKLWRVLHKGDSGPSSLAIALETLIGVRPASIQQGCEGARCRIETNSPAASRGGSKMGGSK